MILVKKCQIVVAMEILVSMILLVKVFALGGLPGFLTVAPFHCCSWKNIRLVARSI